MLRAAPPIVPVALVSFALACGPTPTTASPPAAPAPPAPAAVATAAPAPPAPTHVDAGGMPASLDLYMELPDTAGLLAAVRSKPGVGMLPLGLVLLAGEAGIPPGTADALVNGIRSAHLGGKRSGADVAMAASLAFADAAPVRSAIQAGVFEPSGAVGDYGQRLTVHADKGSTTFVWFEGPRLLVAGDEPMIAAVTAVVEGRAKPVRQDERGVPVLAGDPGRQLVAFVAPALLDEAARGKVAFPSPVSAGYGLWEGGIRGGWRAALGVPGSRADSPLPPPRALALARRLPSETAAYLALSTTIPGGARGLRDLIAVIASTFGATPDVAGLDAALGMSGVRLDDLVGALGGEGVAAVSVRRGVTSEAELQKGFAAVFVQEIADPKPLERALAWAKKEAAHAKAFVASPERVRPSAAARPALRGARWRSARPLPLQRPKRPSRRSPTWRGGARSPSRRSGSPRTSSP
jgi:hypothetical protein